MSLKKINKIDFQTSLTRTDEKIGRIVTAIFILMLVIAAIIIVNFTKPIIYDQVIVKYRFQKGYPNISSGIVSHLLIGTYNFLINPSQEILNIHFKLLVMILFMVSSFLLAGSIFNNRFLIILFMGILFVSRYPFLWLSTELIVASLLFLSLWSMVKQFHPVIIALLLALLCFSKPEMVLVSMVLLVYYGIRIHKSSRQAAILVAGFLIFSLLIVMPGIISQGGKYFSGANRSMFSFGQHYAALFSRHQVIPNAPDPWNGYYKYLDTNFKGAHNIFDIIKKYPLKYFDYVLLSFGHGLLKATALLHILLILLVWMIYYYTKEKIRPNFAEKLIYFSFLGYIPLVMLSYPHIRYLARYFPLIIILILLFLKRLVISRGDGETVSKRIVIFAFIILILGIIINSFLFIQNLAGFESVKDFWFPD